MKTPSDYFDSVTRSLITFQHIEETLKMILVRLESLTYFRLKDFSPYQLKPKLDSISNAAMGRLIEMLKIYSEKDDPVISELKEIKKIRDDVAHKSLLLTVDETKNKEMIHGKATELDELDKQHHQTLLKLLSRWHDLDKTLNELCKSNQNLEPIVPTPAESGSAQSTQAHV